MTMDRLINVAVALASLALFMLCLALLVLVVTVTWKSLHDSPAHSPVTVCHTVAADAGMPRPAYP